MVDGGPLRQLDSKKWVIKAYLSFNLYACLVLYALIYYTLGFFFTFTRNWFTQHVEDLRKDLHAWCMWTLELGAVFWWDGSILGLQLFGQYLVTLVLRSAWAT